MFGREPAMILAAVQAVLLLVVAFGLDISNEQQVAILGAGGAILALLGGAVVRSKVTPTE